MSRADWTKLHGEHSPVVDVSHGGVLVFRDPDNIQLEFIFIPPEVAASISAAAGGT